MLLKLVLGEKKQLKTINRQQAEKETILLQRRVELSCLPLNSCFAGKEFALPQQKTMVLLRHQNAIHADIHQTPQSPVQIKGEPRIQEWKDPTWA